MPLLSSIRARRTAKHTVIYVFLISFIFIVSFPFYWMFVCAIQKEHAVFSVPPILWPRSDTFSLEAFRIAFFPRSASAYDVRPTTQWLLNTILVASLSSAAGILLGLTGGYALSRFRVIGTSFLGFLILLTQMLPGSLIIIPVYMIMSDLGLVNSLWGLNLPYISAHLPLSIWLLKGFYDGIPVDLEEQALIDGCTRIGAMFRIVTPLILPGIIAVFILNFISSWGEFVTASTLLDSRDKWTYSVGVASLKGEFQTKWTEVMAISLVGTLPIFLLFLYMQRYLLAGLTTGGVKG